MGLFNNIKSIAWRKSKDGSASSRSVIYSTTFNRLNRRFGNREKATSYLASNMHRFYISSSKFNKGLQIKNLFRKVDIDITGYSFIYFLDEFKNLNMDGQMIEGITVDYSKILNQSIYDYNGMYFNPKEGYRMKLYSDSDFIRNQQDMLDGIELLIYRIIKKLKKSNRQDKAKFVGYFEDMLDKPAQHFEEALQRILFFNQILWQTGHNLNGLGRLDKILEDYYFDDINGGVLSQGEVYDLIKDFIKALHSYNWFKSDEFLGDTGQTIVLGGKYGDDYGEYYFYNDLTYMFIKAIKELQLPEPKIMLRISNETPRDLIGLALETLDTGIGSPLFSNDEILIERMVEFGYDRADAVDYVISGSCQPSALGKDLEQNNMACLSFLKPLNEFFDNETKEFLDNLISFDELLNSYKYYLKKEADSIIHALDGIEWNEDPVLSLFIDDCNEKSMDISKGGAKYNHYGISTVALSSTVDSLYNINKLVFEDKKYTLNELNKMRMNNFKKDKFQAAFNELKDMKPCFGMDDWEIVDLTNEIIQFLEDCFRDYRNDFGGEIKFGLSSSGIVSMSKDETASFDGRKEREPFSTNISLDSSNDFTELLRFASKIDYGGAKINGNVADMLFPQNFIKKHIGKFTDFIYSSIKLGFFQMQINVLDSKTLIDAKENPDAHSNLIVRVCGFSAYFNDLPEDYQDLLINRALKSEGKLRD